MKRFHVHVSVSDLDQSIRFYSTLFGQTPTVEKPDYAKWMMEDPRVNFAISKRREQTGIEHLGIQAESMDELIELTTRLRTAEIGVQDEMAATCCYAKSDKGWVNDPDNIVWESFYTSGESTTYSDPTTEASDASACCTPVLAPVSLGMPTMKKPAADKSCCA
jgi:catechol 2,3-dioxygenase-like lactoylglutathione lyase family enzyme